DKVRRLFKVGIPISLQETLLQVSFLFITAIVNSMGVVAAAAVGIAGKFDAFAMLPAMAFSGAIAAIAAQNIGAGQPERAKKSLYASIVMSLLCSFVFFFWAQLFPESIMQIFKADPSVIAAATDYLRTFSFDFILVAFGFCFLGFFNGCGRTTFSMINGVAASLLVRLPLAWILSLWVTDSLLGIGAAAPIATLVSIVAEIIYLKMGRWRSPLV
ncbi:MAG: MATE family efflux transporter, partial [Eubacterium sp.]